MRLKCTHAMIMLGFVFCLPLMVQAKVWRVNNNTGVNADFSNVNTAINHVSVQTGDTIYVEPSAAGYSGGTLSKRLVIIGAGYFLLENLGLQYSTNDSNIGMMSIDSLGSGSVFMGLRASTIFVNSNVDNLVFHRMSGNINANNSSANSRMTNWIINKCYLGNFSFSSSSYFFENLHISNCIISGSFNASTMSNGLIRNNVFTGSVSTANAYLSNNIFTTVTASNVTTVNCTVKYNIAVAANTLPAGNNNQNGIPVANIFTNTGSSDSRYMLRAGSPAIAAGEPINGVTPDMGAYGTDDPYRLSGIPPIPAIYALTVPASVPSTASSMTITVSSRSNN